MMRRRSLWVALVLASCWLAVPLGGLARTKHSAPPATGLKAIAFGVRPPDFLYDVGKGPTLLSGDYGKPVVINFWATWCEPCRDELPAFENLEKAYGERATLITLSSEDPAIVQKFLSDRGVALPVSDDRQRRVFDEYSIGPIPVTIVLDPNGTVSHVAVGELDWKELQAAVNASLALEATPAPNTPAPPATRTVDPGRRACPPGR